VTEHSRKLDLLLSQPPTAILLEALKLGTRRGKGRPKRITMEKPKETYSAISSTHRTEEEENTPAVEDEANSDLNMEVRVEARADMLAEVDCLIGLLGDPLATSARDLQEAPAAVEVLPAAQAVELPDTPEAGELLADVKVASFSRLCGPNSVWDRNQSTTVASYWTSVNTGGVV
jgi:hypothetical protein